MFFYDIMYLYKAYENYVTEEKKSQEEQQAEYQEQYDVNSMKNDAMNKFKQNHPTFEIWDCHSAE